MGITMKDRLTLREVTRENLQAALRLGVLPEQQRFISDYAPIAAVALAKAYVHSFGFQWIPYALYWEAEMIGFVALAYEDSPEHRSKYWVFHFFIDGRYQGQGYGRGALALLIAETRQRHPACRVLRLTVHPENAQAQHLYTQAGFVATGETLDEEPVYQLRLYE
jgi:diamine N-acetyltransferase